MPMYEFLCSECGYRFEELVFSANSPLDQLSCPECGSKKIGKLISVTASCGTGNSGVSGGSCGPLPSGGFG